MSFSLKRIKEFIVNKFFNTKWRCNACGREIFDGKYFCDKCEKELPFVKGPICLHCGRETVVPEEYCSTCKNMLTAVDKGRSVFNYEKPISGLIKKAKYSGAKYLIDVFSEYLYLVYTKNYFNADVATFIPMTEKAQKKRGYNQSELLARKFGELSGVKVEQLLVKKKETEHQAKLDRSERLKNLTDVFRTVNKKEIKDKSVIIIDDVSTTGSTGQAVAEKLKSAGAKCVYLLTVASVSRKPKKEGEKNGII